MIFLMNLNFSMDGATVSKVLAEKWRSMTTEDQHPFYVKINDQNLHDEVSVPPLFPARPRLAPLPLPPLCWVGMGMILGGVVCEQLGCPSPSSVPSLPPPVEPLRAAEAPRALADPFPGCVSLP